MHAMEQQRVNAQHVAGQEDAQRRALEQQISDFLSAVGMVPTHAMEQQLAIAQHLAGRDDRAVQRGTLEQQQIKDFLSAIGEAIYQLRHREAALDRFKEQLAIRQASAVEVVREPDRIALRAVNTIKKLAAETQEFKEAFFVGFLTGLIPIVGTGYLLLQREEWLLQQAMGKFGNLKVATVGLAHSAGMAAAYYGYHIARTLLAQDENSLSSKVIPLTLGLTLQAGCMLKVYANNKSFKDVTGLFLAECLICSLLYLVHTGMTIGLSGTDYVGLAGFAYIGYQALLFLPRSRLRHA